MQNKTSINKFYDRYEFFPLTILETSIENCQKEIMEIIQDWWGEIKIVKAAVDLNKINHPPELAHGNAHFIKLLIWQPIKNPNVTALFVNSRDGYGSLIKTWNLKFSKKGISIRTSNDDISAYPHHELIVYTIDKDERIIYTHKESKWAFFECGPVQEFEILDFYTNRKISARFNNNIIDNYMSTLGFEIWNDEFYNSLKEGIYFEQLSYK